MRKWLHHLRIRDRMAREIESLKKACPQRSTPPSIAGSRAATLPAAGST